MNKKKICLIVDHPIRDLPSAILMSLELRKKFKVYLINFYQYYELFFINPDIIFLNHVRDDYLFLLNILKKFDKKVVVHEQEGGYFGPKKIDYYNFIKRNYEKANYFDLFFIWGKMHFDIISNYKEFQKSKHKFILSGSPRIDVLKFHKKNKNKCVRFDLLYNLNSNSINPKFGKNKYKKYITDLDFKNSHLIPLKEKRKINKIHENIRNIIALSKYYTVLVRPHPFEDESIYINFFKNNKNIFMSNNQALPHDVSISKFVISSFCQTAFDTFVLKKPNISLAYLDKTSNYKICPAHFISAAIIKSKKDFRNQIKNFKNIKFVKKNIIKFQDIVYNYDTYSYKKISYEISKLRITPSKISYLSFFYFLLNQNFMQIIKIIFIIFFGLKNYLLFTKKFKSKKNINKFFTINDCNIILKEFNFFKKKNYLLREISSNDYSTRLHFRNSKSIIIE